MQTNEFLKLRSHLPKAEDVPEEDDLHLCKSVFVPVITSNGVMISVQKKVRNDDLKVPYTTYSNSYMLKNGVQQLKDVPLSSFAVFDALSQIKASVKESSVNESGVES